MSINPNNTAVSGLANNSSLTYGVAFISCDTATANGTTGSDSDRISDLRLTFDDCADAVGAPVEVDCLGTVTLIADPDADDTGMVELNDGFECAITSSICTGTVVGPQTTDPKNTTLDEENDILRVDWEWHMTRVGSALCGPAESTGRLEAEFALTPSNLTIDP